MNSSERSNSRAELVEDRHHLGLRRDVERRGRLVGEQQPGLGEQRRRDHHALQQAAGELVRVAGGAARAPSSMPTCRSSSIARRSASASAHALVVPQRLRHEVADPAHRVRCARAGPGRSSRPRRGTRAGPAPESASTSRPSKRIDPSTSAPGGRSGRSRGRSSTCPSPTRRPARAPRRAGARARRRAAPSASRLPPEDARRGPRSRAAGGGRLTGRRAHRVRCARSYRRSPSTLNATTTSTMQDAGERAPAAGSPDEQPDWFSETITPQSGFGRLHAEPEERDRGEVDHRVAEQDRRLRDDQRRHVRHEMPQADRRSPTPPAPRARRRTAGCARAARRRAGPARRTACRRPQRDHRRAKPGAEHRRGEDREQDAREREQHVEPRTLTVAS